MRLVVTTGNRENMLKLADALESGKYVQGEGVLRSESDKFCCLGVACDISGLGQWSPSFSDTAYHYIIEKAEDKRELGRSLLSESMCEWLGTTDGGAFRKGGNDNDNTPYETLTSLNDNGTTFAEIAAILRAESIRWYKFVDEDEN